MFGMDISWPSILVGGDRQKRNAGVDLCSARAMSSDKQFAAALLFMCRAAPRGTGDSAAVGCADGKGVEYVHARYLER
jgi:hypothetical protein